MEIISFNKFNLGLEMEKLNNNFKYYNFFLNLNKYLFLLQSFVLRKVANFLLVKSFILF